MSDNQRGSSCLVAQYFLNHKLSAEEVESHISLFATAGYQGVFAHARQGLLTPYLSDEWWEIIDHMVESCRRHGLEFWIWDEDYFPSGRVGGRIVWEYPELASQSLQFSVRRFDDVDSVDVILGKGYLIRAYALELDGKNECVAISDVTAFCGTRRQQWTERHLQHSAYSPHVNPAGPPHWRCNFVDNTFSMTWKPPRKGTYVIVGVTAATIRTEHPDLMNPLSAEHFIEMTHQQYFTRHGDSFGAVIKGVFMDEPSPGCELYPWSRHFPEEYKKDHGYDILDNLAHLAWEVDGRSPVVRSHFRQTQHRLLVDNFLAPIGRWCRGKKIVFAGHLTRTEWLNLTAAWWPNELRCYKHIDIPCADPLGKAYGWKDTAAYHTGLKVVSSAAHIFGKAQAGSDCLAVIGDESSIRDLKSMLDYQIVMGVNYFAVHGLSYSIDGPRKDEVPPSLFYQHSEWEHMGQLSNYVRSTCERLTGGEHKCQILMLYPSLSLAARQLPPQLWGKSDDEERIHQLIDLLLSRQKDFDFIDEATLQESVDSNGRLDLPEKYGMIVLPYICFIGEDAATALTAYARNGGTVIVVDSIPKIIPNNIRKEPVSLDFSQMSHVLDVNTSNVDSLFPGSAKVSGHGGNDVFVMAYRKNAQDYCFAYNRSDKEFRGTINDASVVLPPVTGGFVDTDGIPASHNKSPLRLVAELNTDWHVEFEDNQLPLTHWQFLVGEEALRRNETYSPGRMIDLSNHEKPLAAVKNGPLVYRYRFMLSSEIPNMRIVLEESSLTGSWKLQVNGHPVTEWRKGHVYDCRNLYAGIGPFLRTDSSPVLNTIEFVWEGEGGELHEVPYLYGSFACKFPHCHKSLPQLSGHASAFTIPLLADWAALGYPTFSGKAQYVKQFSTTRDGVYVFDLGRVEDLAEIVIDEKLRTTLAWPPYRCQFHLAQGDHRLVINLLNGPGNRYRSTGLPAGLLGPVQVYSTATP